MKIHTVKRGERLAGIAEEYGVCCELLARVNGLGIREALAVGEQLAVIVPTRTHRVARGDTVDRIALRFGIRKAMLYALNPQLLSRGVALGETLILHAGEPPSLASASVGVVYRGATERALQTALPYLTYAAISERVANDDGIKQLYSPDRYLKIINAAAKIPLMRLSDSGTGKRYKSRDLREKTVTDILFSARKGGYKGVMLAVGKSARGSDEDFAAFLLELRRRMIGEDLILITECDESSPLYLSELSDGAVFSYDRCGDTELDFDSSERAAATKFAAESESAKSFLDFPPFAFSGGEYITLSEARKAAIQCGAEITTDEKNLLSSYEYRGKKTVFPSLESIKAKLELSSELGFMGIAFDIMRTPLNYLYTFGSHARCVHPRLI